MSISQAIQEDAESYIRACYPSGCPAKQQIEIKLALYGGMASALRQFGLIVEKHGDDDEAAVKEIEEWIQALTDRARALNDQRQSI